MSDVDQDSKTELPTEKHLSEAHEKGQFAKSPEISVVAMLAATLVALSLTLGTAVHDVGSLAVNIFSQLHSIQLVNSTMPSQVADILIVIGKALLPIIGAAVVAALVSGGLQSGFRFTPEVIGLRFENLNPASGFQKHVSKAVLVRSGVDLLKLVCIGMVLWVAARGLFRDPLFSAPVEAAYLGQFLRTATMTFLSRLILMLGVIAAISYFYELYKSRRDLMMTRQEVKEEGKQAEGDGLVKNAMRRMARRLVQKQMLANVPTADVIVTNPTHYAVALKYERGRDKAPVILAKGENQFARRIKALAAEHGVPMIENKPVARMLYALGRVDEPIPSELYQAVAEILAFVYRTHRYYFYRLKSRRAEAATAAVNVEAQTEF
ncbi:MAG: EscU/YscU/HrcU family type III secretion system export apparatus switch protein [Verrucomicrobia bacterium]|nr:EscU/YscU/HrcU family type III secretion system export apparatus switch protein [Verrucomicrobiota bacterium]